MTTDKASQDEESEIKAVLTEKGGGAESLFSFRTFTWIAFAILALGFAYIFFLSGQSANKQSYVTEPVVTGDLTATVTATGSVEPTNVVEISSELSGTVRKVHVDNNSRVEVGQELAALDMDKLNASVASARAKLTASRAKVREAEATVLEMKKDFERKESLAQKAVVSGHDLDAARAAYDRSLALLESTKADVGVAEAELKVQETNLSKACICSPIKGVVLSRNVEPGQIVASSLQAPVLFSIAEDLKEIEVQVDVDEADVGMVREGQMATFTVDAYADRKFSASIRELHFGSEVIQGVVTYKAVLATKNEDLALRPGMTATAEIVVSEEKSALLVPNAALRYSPPSEDAVKDDRNFFEKMLPGPPRFRAPSKTEETGSSRTLWILKDGVPAPVKVETGMTDGKRTVILKGDISSGTPVILDSGSSGS